MNDEHARRPPTQDHKSSLALWAADCAERVLHYFEENRSQDPRPRRAVEAIRSWARGELLFRKVREAALGAHAAARTTYEVAARMAARAAGQAAGTAHVAGHARHAAADALKAINAAGAIRQRNVIGSTDVLNFLK
jgi:hypothetical protein